MSTDSRPNVLLIVSEDHGPHLGCYGDPNARTPTLDRLAAEGARFDNHHTTCAICSPGRASILTGLHTHENGQINLATHRYAMYRPFRNVISILKENGYRTGRLGKLHVLPEEAFPFDFIWNDAERISFKQRDVHRTAEVAGEFAADGDEPFLLYACFADAHLPELHQSYGEPANPLTGDDITLPDFCPIDSPHMRDRLAGYYNCLERMDTGIELMLEQLKKHSDRETIVIFTTDHGQQFIRGKVTCYEGGLRVSMLMHAPGRVAPGQVRTELTSHIDILPTLLDMLDIELPDHRSGRSMLPLARGEDVPWHDYVVGQWTGSPRMWFPQRSIRDGRYKLIVNYLAGERRNNGAAGYLPPGLWETSLDEDDLAATPPDLRAALERSVDPPREELYDLQADPTELYNLADDPKLASVRDRLRTALEDWQRQHSDHIADPEVLEVLDEMHARIAEKHYAPHGGVPRDKMAIKWDYARWIDPAVRV